MKKLGVVFGGDSLEHDISIVTGLNVIDECKTHKIPYIPIYIGKSGEFYTGKALENKANYQNKKGFKKLTFVFKSGTYFAKINHKLEVIDCALLCVHGKNVEDGTIGALFDLMKIPCSYSGISSSAILQDKELTKIMCKTYKIPIVKYQIIRKYENNRINIKYPCIIKPVHLGSSIGVYKVKNEEELKEKIEEIWCYDDKIMVEEVVNNLHEFNIAGLGDEDGVELSAIEEVNSEDRVLDFSDKYEQFKGDSIGRIIPAEIGNDLKKRIEEYARKAFLKLECRGVVRFDFLYDDKNDKLYLNEINAIPGSLAFYLFEKVGISFFELINKLKYLSFKAYKNKTRLMSSYSLSNLMNIGRKK